MAASPEPVAAAAGMEAALKSIVARGTVPSDFEVRYDDMHALWGGTTITVRGNGTAVRSERSRGQTAARVTTYRVSRARLLGLIRLLIELRAWEQRTPNRPAAPDESRATLSISVGSHTSGVWGWFNEMPKDVRISRIKAAMLATTSQ